MSLKQVKKYNKSKCKNSKQKKKKTRKVLEGVKSSVFNQVKTHEQLLKQNHMGLF